MAHFRTNPESDFVNVKKAFRQKKSCNLVRTVQPLQYMLDCIKRREILATCYDSYFYVFDLRENKVLKIELTRHA